MLLTGTLELDDESLDKIYKLATRNKTMKIDDPENLEKVRNILSQHSNISLLFYLLARI